MQGGRSGPALGAPPLPGESLAMLRGALSGGGLLLGSELRVACSVWGAALGPGLCPQAWRFPSAPCLRGSALEAGC
eukprot:3712473-Pyramimonas_sp.AAC.1